MKFKQWLKQAETKLKAAGIGSSRLDALILLEDELGKDRSWLLAHPETTLQGQSLQTLDRRIERRLKHEPLAYIRGFSEFYGRKFIVNKEVLEPRPESETMVELLLDLAKSQKLKAKSLTIVDVGTGSGALAITAKLEIPQAEVIATDIDPKCLSVAKRNARAHSAKIKFRQGDLLQPLLAFSFQLSAILANLPYVPRNLRTNQAAAMEPRLAIDGGQDGLEVYRRFFEQLTKLEHKPKFILTESLPPQHKKMAEIAKAVGYKLDQTNDFIQVFAMV